MDRRIGPALPAAQYQVIGNATQNDDQLVLKAQCVEWECLAAGWSGPASPGR
jgi:hypothetical protein